MASIITGYEYDIFISYRQKDNEYDEWVTEFVNNLKRELHATFKEEISIYFDANPIDGLLETHIVDESLAKKLKCLIFIPIISQTYCDLKSFAWQHEFIAFNKMAKEDQFGRDIRLAGGNVASRILPIKINDLDPEDKTLLENELGGVLRSIDFIYKASGVNRPLKPNDERAENLNHTYYRDQINKVANAVKEVITAIKKYNQQDGEIPKEVVKAEHEHLKKLKPKIIIPSIIVLALIVLMYFFIPKLFESSNPVEKSIAVLPFRNLSNDTMQLPFYDGFMEDILNNLQKVKSFTVRPRTSSYQYRDTKKSTTVIGKELNVNYLVGGSVGREGNNLKIRLTLTDAKADKQVWSKDYISEINQLFSVQSEIAKEIASELKAELTPEEIKKIEKRPTENPEAYNYYIQGNYYYWKENSGDRSTAMGLYEKAVGLDPGYALAYTGIAICLLDQYWYYENHSDDILRKSKQAIEKAFKIDPDLPDAHLALGVYYYYGHLNYPEALKQFELVLKDQPKNSDAILWSAAVHRRAGNWKIAKAEFEKALDLDPRRSEIAVEVGETCDMLRDYSEAEKFYNMAIMLQPEWVSSYVGLSRMFLRGEGDMIKARGILVNAARNCKNSVSDSTIIETNVFIDIYEGKYKEALKDISLLKHDLIQTQFYFRPKYLYYATIYGLMNKPELEHAYYDSTRILLEKRIIDLPEDQRLYSSLGIAYAGLGLNEKAIRAGEKAIKLLPVSKEAYKGPFLVEDLAQIYVMVGKYDEAIRQIKYLLSIPGFLSTKILELDPRWAPLRNRPEFKKMMESYSGK
jgi:TolB-like protein/Flp pilus assembly protein TadD